MSHNGRFLTSLVDPQTGEVYDVKAQKARRAKRVYARYVQLNVRAISYLVESNVTANTLLLLFHLTVHMNKINYAEYSLRGLQEALQVHYKTLKISIEVLEHIGAVRVKPLGGDDVAIEVHPAFAWKSDSNSLNAILHIAWDIESWPRTDWGLYCTDKGQAPV